jgi:alpha-D-xyloside xylohydrolase
MLRIGDTKGSFPGMLKSRRFNIVIVSANKGGEENMITQPDREITYTGKELSIKF